MRVHWGRVTAAAVGVALLAVSAFLLLRFAESGVVALVGLVAAGAAVAILSLSSSVERVVRPADLGPPRRP